MKYIIDIPDEAIDFMGGHDHISIFAEPECKVGDRKHYALRISKEDITPYTEPDRKAIEDEVWKLASKLIWTITERECKQIFGMEAVYVPRDMPYSEAKSKYEAWKKQKEEIHVGDEVQYSLAGYEYTFIVFGKENDTLYGIRSDCENGLDDLDDIYDGWETCYKSDNTLRKTGRHFDEVERLLERMKAE